jgi:hypothetical protein
MGLYQMKLLEIDYALSALVKVLITSAMHMPSLKYYASLLHRCSAISTSTPNGYEIAFADIGPADSIALPPTPLVLPSSSHLQLHRCPLHAHVSALSMRIAGIHLAYNVLILFTFNGTIASQS